MGPEPFRRRLTTLMVCLFCAAASTETTANGERSAAATMNGESRGVLRVGEPGASLFDRPWGEATGRIRRGVTLPFDEARHGFAHVTTPCERRGWISLDSGRLVGPVRVAIDPGHGGSELGSVGSTGLTEKEVNLDVAVLAAEALGRSGIGAVLTRTQDYQATLGFRAILARDAAVEVMVSVHHNASPDEHRDTPGTETYYQRRAQRSKWLAGLVYEEVYRAFDVPGVRFAANRDAGAKWRLNPRGADFYGILRRPHEWGITAVLSEAAFLTNPEEETLLASREVRRREADAIARAIQRHFRGERPGAVFKVPVRRPSPRVLPGTPAECVDPH